VIDLNGRFLYVSVSLPCAFTDIECLKISKEDMLQQFDPKKDKLIADKGYVSKQVRNDDIFGCLIDPASQSYHNRSRDGALFNHL
jgi:hypothetical protein